MHISSRLWVVLSFLSLVLVGVSHSLYAESQGNDYKGITDPFGDPSNYEFSEDEKEDKEFFHLGRYLMLGFDTGLGVFTGGLGKITTPGFMVGGKLVYFFDKSIAFEAALHYARQTKTLTLGTQDNIIDTTLIPITAAFRYYFDTKNAPKAIAVANPYLVGGAGIYIRNEAIVAGQSVPPASTNSFGAMFGAGSEFNIYLKHLYLGIDIRYHLVFFPDADATYNGQVAPGTNAGNYLTTLITLTYNF
jgi:Outer membrane protein beta-barrel domain